MPTPRLTLPLAVGAFICATLFSAPLYAQALARADVDGDCVVTRTDATLVQAGLGRKRGQAGYTDAIDVTQDGVVNNTDLTFVSRNLGRTVCTATPPAAPTITASVSPAANASGWHSANVTVSFTCSNATSCPAAHVVSTEGANQVVQRMVQNSAGVTASASVTISLDKTPPLLDLTAPASAGPSSLIAVGVLASDLSGLASAALKIDGVAAGSKTSPPFDFQAALPAGVPLSGSRILEVTGTDRAGNTASSARLVQIVVADTLAPVVSLSAPTIAAPGKQIPLTASAQDDRGVTQLTLAQVVDNQHVALGAISQGPFVLQRPFTVPDVPDGTLLVFSAKAVDAAANQGAITATVTVQRTVDTQALTLQVDPPVPVTFQSSTVLTGRINSGVTSEPPVAPPFVASLTPTQGRQGDTVDIAIAGANTNFNAATTQIAFGPGITLQSLNVIGPNDVVVRLRIDSKASLGPRLVAVSTGKEEALLPNAFTIVSGLGSVSGRLVTTDPTHAPIASGQICAPAAAVCTTSGPGGLFTLANVPTTAGRITATATGFTGASVPVLLGLSQTVSLGDILLAPVNELPPPPEPGAPVLPGLLGSAVARLSIAFTEPQSLTLERARKLVVDAILLVGADELGVLGPGGAQLNPDVSGPGLLSLNDQAVTMQARGLQQGVSTSLEELWFSMVMSFEWTNPGPPTLDAFVASLQARVNEAWADPSAPTAALPILLFNQGPAFSKLAPVISKSTRVVGLQALFIYIGPLFQAYHANAGLPAPAPEALARSTEGPSWFGRLFRAAAGSISLAVNRPSAVSPLRSVSPGLRGTLAERGGARTMAASRTTTEQSGSAVSRRQLSRSLKDAAAGFFKNFALNLAGNLLFGMPAAAASGGLLGVTLFTAAVGAMTDAFLFSAIGVALAAKLAPPPPEIVGVTQVGNKVAITMKRVPLDLRCRTELLKDPASTAGLCNFQYTVYRAGGGSTRIVVARYVPPFALDSPTGVFTVEDNFPVVGANTYYADVIHKFPMQLTPGQQSFAGMIGLPTKIGIPVGNVLSLFFLTELISDFSRPNPHPFPGDPEPPDGDWDHVRLTFAPVPPTTNYAFMRSDLLKNVFAADTGFNRIPQVAPGGANVVVTPAFGRSIGLDTDRLGNVYTVSEQSQGTFGGRVFQFTPTGAQNFIGTVNKYSPLLDTGRPVSVAAIALGPKVPGRDGAYVPGDIFVADNMDRSVKRLLTSIIPSQGISGLPAPGHGIFGAMAASPIVGQPYVQLPSCAGASRAIRDIAFDRANNLWMIVGQELYRVGYDPATGQGTGLVPAADLNGGSHVPPALRLLVREQERTSLAVPNKGKAFVNAEWQPCGGTLQWTVSDEEVVSYRVVQESEGASRIEIRGKKPGTVTVMAKFSTPGGASMEKTLTVKVLETGPILFVHGWIGSASGWQPVVDQLVNRDLLDGGYLCARWTKLRGRFVRTQSFDGTFRPGNTDPFRCDDAAEDGAVFVLNFDDNQNRFIDTAGELADIVDQITTAIGGEDCKTLPNQSASDPWPAQCPRLTLVAHSMGGQTSRAFIQSIPHGGLTAGDWPVGATGVPAGGQRIGMPFRPFRNQVAKLVTLGTMNLGTPAPNLTQNESVIFWGMVPLPLLSIGAAAGLDPFSSAILSMRVGSPELQLLMHDVSNLKRLELVSIVTRAPANLAIDACAYLNTTKTAADVLAVLSPSWIVQLISFIGGQLVDGFVSNIFGSLDTKFCGAGTALDLPLYGSAAVGEPFLANSDEIVGVDSQNVNNLFRYLAQGPSGISHAFVNEAGLGHGASPEQRLAHPAPAKVVTVPDKLHHEDTYAVAEILPELDLTAPAANPNGRPQTTTHAPAQLPAVARVLDPRNLAVDSAGNVFISDRSNGSVTVIDVNRFSNTFVTGITGLGPVAVNNGFLYASRGTDIIRVPLGVSGQVKYSNGDPARLAQITVRAAGGFQTRTVMCDANGNFNIGLESLATSALGDQLILFLTVTTQGTNDHPSQTVEVEVPVAVSDTGERTQTTVILQIASQP